jgi:hypothetical protein
MEFIVTHFVPDKKSDQDNNSHAYCQSKDVDKRKSLLPYHVSQRDIIPFFMPYIMGCRRKVKLFVPKKKYRQLKS